MAIGKELIPYKFNAPSKKIKKTVEQKAPSFFERSGKYIKGIGAKTKKMVPKVNTQYRLLGEAGKGLAKGARFAIANPLVSLGVAGGSYLLGRKSRQYAKAPKVGEDRDLNSRLIRRGI